MSQQDLLIAVVRFLEADRQRYLITGSIASSLLGEPRATHDIDLVVAMTPEAVLRLATAFPPPRYYLDPEAARAATLRRGMFNLLDSEEGDKVDFWMLRDEAFDQSCMSRRVVVEAFGVRLWVASAEDLVLAKLRWSVQSGGSERQWQDALGVFDLQRSRLDLSYMRTWADTLGVRALLDRLESGSAPD